MCLIYVIYIPMYGNARPLSLDVRTVINLEVSSWVASTVPVQISWRLRLLLVADDPILVKRGKNERTVVKFDLVRSRYVPPIFNIIECHNAPPHPCLVAHFALYSCTYR